MAQTILEKVTSPDIRELVSNHPELSGYFDETRGRYDFNSSEGIFPFTEAILSDYFDLDVELDRSHLCPRVPNRLDYIEWIKSIVEWQPVPTTQITGVDIGVGASCIYPLLGCKVTPWRFYGTEINPSSFEKCQQNVERNGFSDRINLIHTSSLFSDIDAELTFSMCNPPFYSSLEDMKASRDKKLQGHSPPELWAKDNELYTPGGEEQFTLDMLQESYLHQLKVTWFSTMVGKKTTLETLVNVLRGKYGIDNYGIHEISRSQKNKTKRWTLVWTFTDLRIRDDLARTKTSALKSLNPPQTLYTVPKQVPVIELSQVLEEFQPYLTISRSVDGDRLILTSEYGDVWSRSFRRKISRNEEVPRSGSSYIKILLQSVVDTQVEIHWLQGRDYKIFESFCGMVKSKSKNS